MGQYLQAKRLAAGMSYRALGQALGKAPSTIQSWEQGRRRPDLEDLLVLSRVFATDLDELIVLAAVTAGELKGKLDEVELRYRKEVREAARLTGAEAGKARMRLQELDRQVTFLKNLSAAREELERRKREQMAAARLAVVPIPTAKNVPVLGTIAAGRPRLAVEDATEYTAVLPEVEADYALRVEGDSMVGAGMAPGDLVWVKAARAAEPGETVVALLGGEEVTVKHYVIEKGRPLLRANNPYRDYPDIPLGPADQIIGVVERVVKRPGPPPGVTRSATGPTPY